MMKERLSPRQERILEFLREFMEEHSYPPTVRDIQRGCEVSSTSVVDYNLRQLQAKGYLRREPEVSRGIELLGEARRRGGGDLLSVPIMGSIAAGEPLFEPDAPSYASDSFDSIDLPPFLTQNRPNVFALRVQGESMIDALVADGDLVLLEPATNADANSGDMVAAWLSDREEATLKRFYIEGDMVRLQPENASMSPIMVPADRVSVRGKVVGVVRTL